MYIRNRLSGITQAQRDMYLSDLFAAQSQYAIAQQALQACIANSEGMFFCNDGNIANAPAYWQGEIARLQSLLSQPVDAPAINAPSSPSSPASQGPQSITAPNASGTPPSMAPITYGVSIGSDGMPVQTEVQTFSGEMLLPGSVNQAATGATDNKGWLALLAAGALLVMGG